MEVGTVGEEGDIEIEARRMMIGIEGVAGPHAVIDPGAVVVEEVVEDFAPVPAIARVPAEAAQVVVVVDAEACPPAASPVVRTRKEGSGRLIGEGRRSAADRAHVDHAPADHGAPADHDRGERRRRKRIEDTIKLDDQLLPEPRPLVPRNQRQHAQKRSEHTHVCVCNTHNATDEGEASEIKKPWIAKNINNLSSIPHVLHTAILVFLCFFLLNVSQQR